ncbi:MAG: hypothetical protein ACK6DC_02585 [Planctomycetota bacterium]|jgi:hypothetical protein
MRKFPTRLGLLIPWALAAGCGASVTTAPTRGVIKTTKGQACEKALIVFHPTDSKRINDPKPLAVADANGSFVVRTFTTDDGAIPGEYGVTVVWPTATEAEKPKMSLFGDEGSGGGGPDRLKGRYGNPKQPRIKVTIPKEGDPNLSIQVEE